MNSVGDRPSAFSILRILSRVFHGVGSFLSRAAVRKNSDDDAKIMDRESAGKLSRLSRRPIRKSIKPVIHLSTVPLFLLLISPISLHDVAWLYERYVCPTASVDFEVTSISYYKETDLSTGASLYFTEVVVTQSDEECSDRAIVKTPIDLRLALEDGSVIDTSWSDSSQTGHGQQTFNFESRCAPEYAQLDLWDKLAGNLNYANNSRAVDDFLLPVMKWVGRVFEFVQNALLSTGVLV